MNNTPSEVSAIVGAINPQSAAAGNYDTGYIDMRLFRRFQAVIQSGAMTASGTIDAKLIGSIDTAGTGAADIAGTTITQLTQASADGNKQVLVNLDTARLAKTGFKFFRLRVTTATAASLLSAVVLGFDPRYLPASDNDAATVDEIVSV